MPESLRPSLLDLCFAAPQSSYLVPKKKSAVYPSIEQYCLCCLHPSTPLHSSKWNFPRLTSLHSWPPPVSRNSSRIPKDRKGILLCQAIPEDDEDAEEERGHGKVAAPPASDGRIDIVINKLVIQQLDLSPAHAVLSGYVNRIGDNTPKDPKELLRRTVGFVIDYQWDDPHDMRELSELPDVRLWFVRLDAMYPWLPVVLDWRAGELARYAAMLVPHQMKKKEGLVFNPEGLELFVMSKLFTVYPWLLSIKLVKADAKVNDMLKVLGYNIETELFQLLESP